MIGALAWVVAIWTGAAVAVSAGWAIVVGWVKARGARKPVAHG